MTIMKTRTAASALFIGLLLANTSCNTMPTQSQTTPTAGAWLQDFKLAGNLSGDRANFTLTIPRTAYSMTCSPVARLIPQAAELLE